MWQWKILVTLGLFEIYIPVVDISSDVVLVNPSLGTSALKRDFFS